MAGEYVVGKVKDATVGRGQLRCPVEVCRQPLAPHDVQGILGHHPDGDAIFGKFDEFRLRDSVEREVRRPLQLRRLHRLDLLELIIAVVPAGAILPRPWLQLYVFRRCGGRAAPRCIL